MLRQVLCLIVLVSGLLGESIGQECVNGSCQVRMRAVPATPVRSALRNVFQPNDYVASSRVAFSDVVVQQNCCEPNSFAIGGRDADGAVITAIGAIQPLQSASVSTAVGQTISDGGRFSVLESREHATPRFRASLLKAIDKSRESGAINKVQYLRLRIALLSPSFLRNAEDLAVTEAVSSGALQTEADGSIDRVGVDWDSLADVLERIIPRILEILKMFNIV